MQPEGEGEKPHPIVRLTNSIFQYSDFVYSLSVDCVVSLNIAYTNLRTNQRRIKACYYTQVCQLDRKSVTKQCYFVVILVCAAHLLAFHNYVDCSTLERKKTVFSSSSLRPFLPPPFSFSSYASVHIYIHSLFPFFFWCCSLVKHIFWYISALL